MGPVVELLSDEDASVRSSVAEVLGGWGGGHGAAEAVLAALGVEDQQAAVKYLEACGEEARAKCPRELAVKLADVITPREDDSPADQARREVVFRWLWNASQTS